MCFYKNTGYCANLRHKDAKKDIECYKVMQSYEDNTLSSLVFHTTDFYNVGGTMEAEQHSMDLLDALYMLEKGVIHSYADIELAYELLWRIIRNDSYSNPCVVKCVIPKGTPYWKNRYGEYASTKIIIKEVVFKSGKHITKIII